MALGLQSWISGGSARSGGSFLRTYLFLLYLVHVGHVYDLGRQGSHISVGH